MVRPAGRSKDGFQRIDCVACDLQFFEPMKSPDAAWYLEHNRSRDLLDVGTVGWNHQQFLKRRKGGGGRLLDVGCGTGGFLAAAQGLGYSVTGLDFDEVGVQAARDRLQVDDIHPWSLDEFIARRPHESFDVVSAFEVLEHQEDPRGFLASCAALVRPGGALVLSVPFRDRWPRWNEPWDDPPHHLTRWSKRAIITGLTSVGLQPVELRTGWTATGDLLMTKVRLGLVARDLKRSAAASPTDRARLVRRAALLQGGKRRMFGAVGAFGDVIVRAAGGTGIDMYVESIRPPS
jgi:SAM-dependent methyltransferase